MDLWGLQWLLSCAQVCDGPFGLCGCDSRPGKGQLKSRAKKCFFSEKKHVDRTLFVLWLMWPTSMCGSITFLFRCNLGIAVKSITWDSSDNVDSSIVNNYLCYLSICFWDLISFAQVIIFAQYFLGGFNVSLALNCTQLLWLLISEDTAICGLW